nr:hypothetical protein [Pyrinomonadaceae bacterium]
KDTNPTADSNDFNLRDVADDDKIHQQQVYFFGGLLGLTFCIKASLKPLSANFEALYAVICGCAAVLRVR